MAEANSRSGFSARLRLLPVLLIGLYAWGLTVAPAAYDVAAGPVGIVAGSTGLLCLLSPLLFGQGRWALLLGIEGVLLSSLVVWIVADRAGALIWPGPFGALGWIAFTLAWGALSTPEETPEQADPGPELQPRVPPRRVLLLVSGLLVLSVPILLTLVSSKERPEASILAQIGLLAVVVLVLRGAGRLVASLQDAEASYPRPARVLRAVWLPLSVLLGLGLLATWILLRP